ncbi:MAG: GNAT family N-acetyltransferase [Candidatus Eisenbacteria sp.]|nr:GNAT family N-acetyltransferase [Candidatus Eisenbacteria bacterium]
MPDDWRSLYEARTMDSRQALSAIRSGSRVFMAGGCGRPQLLIDELVHLGSKIADIELIHLMTIGLAPYTSSKYENRFRHNAFFVGSDVAGAVREGRADFTPTNKYQICRLLRDRRLLLDVSLIQVSPPDDGGYVSMGITVGISKTAAECADCVIAEVNPNMPRTCGDTRLHVEQIDAFVLSTNLLLEAPAREVDRVSDEIARHCSRLIGDGATIHVGYTPVTYALSKYLRRRNDLGVHTDILTPPLIELAKQGVITNACKTINAGKIITSLCFGSRETYEYVADNCEIEFHPAEYVNDPFIVARHDRMVAINEVGQVDLTGSVCMRYVGPRFGSSFMIGASHAREGRSIVTLPSATPDEAESNIVMDFDQKYGIAMATNRDDIHYVITEYGIAELVGRTIRERALALIHVAHPKFRDELMYAARARNYVHADQMLQEHIAYPDYVESRSTTADGTPILVRPARPTDERKVQSFLYGMDEASIRYRFHGKLESLHHDRVQSFVNVDYEGTVTILGIRLGDRGGEEEVLAIGQYLYDSLTDQAEVAFTTASSFRCQGIATCLLKTLISMAQDRGIRRVFAMVLRENQAMLRVFRRASVPMESTFEDGCHHVTLDLSATVPGTPRGRRRTAPFETTADPPPPRRGHSH